MYGFIYIKMTTCYNLFMLGTKIHIKKTRIASPLKKEYSSAYQQKLDSAIAEAKNSRKTQSVQDFLKDVRTW